ncbi:nitroreductase family protein [Candidatus Bipolaricaulota bacterium]
MSVQLISAIKNRRTRRAITAQPIDRETLELLFQAAHLAPSCSNNQPWRFVIVEDAAVLGEVKEHLTGGNYWVKASPCIVAAASRGDLDCQIPDGREYYLFGCGVAAMNLMLQATELGLIAHPIAGFKSKAVEEVLQIPGDFTLIALIVLGHPTDDHSALSEKHQIEETAPRDRHPLPDVISWNRFNLVLRETESSST